MTNEHQQQPYDSSLKALVQEQPQEKLDMFDILWEQDPKIQKLRAEERAEGEIRGLQEAVVDCVEARFPTLVEQAQRQVTQIRNPDDLNKLVKQIVTAPDEATAYRILSRLAAR